MRLDEIIEQDPDGNLKDSDKQTREVRRAAQQGKIGSKVRELAKKNPKGNGVANMDSGVNMHTDDDPSPDTSMGSE